MSRRRPASATTTAGWHLPGPGVLAAVGVVSGVVCLVRFDGTLEAAGYAVAMATGSVLALVDARHRVIPRAVLYPGAAVCAALLSAAALVDGRPAALLGAVGGTA